MKSISLSLIAMFLCGCLSAQTKPTVVNNGIRFCESTLPYDGGILVANFGTEELNPLNTEGKGYIKFLKDGKTDTFIAADGNLSAPKGMLKNGDRLFICDVNKIVVYNTKNKNEAPTIIRLPEGNLFVNDLVADGKYMYASVTNTDKIFRIDISGNSYTPEEWLSVPGPNGLYLNNGSMYIASYPADGKTTDKNVIYKVNDIKNPKLEKFIDVPGQYDGIAFSSDKKYIYATNWVPAGLVKINLKSKSVELIKINLDKPLIGPADISVANGKIFIPDLPNSRVVVVNE